MSITVEMEYLNSKRRVGNLKEEDNPELIQEFMKKLLSEGETKLRVIRCANHLIFISEKMGKSFLKVTEENIMTFLSELEQSDYPLLTKRDCITVLKRFFRFLGKEKLVQNVKTTVGSTLENGEFSSESDPLTEAGTYLTIYLMSIISSFFGGLRKLQNSNQ